ncbi:MAG: tRNA 4-thiouridine(8) synthase ThiI [Erysipelotrichaceae bacterium]|nr:tRNA 4-thiouridine(8) synthase ThiI [Erysipelotrichaceae bacterium]MDY3934033.1 tRNA uracil 4-sulfurtransferase ThiI [Bacilli bacterium]
MKKIILIKYGELTTKKDNRNLFINKIYENLSLALSNYDITITKNRVRMFIDPKDNDIDEIISITKNIFGIHSIVVAYKIDSSIDIINSSVLEVIKEVDFNTFKVETDRADKSFPINSMDLSRQLGSLILKNTKDKKVDVHNPDYLLKIEIRSDYTYIYTKEIKALGGYPVGVAGKGLLMLSGGIDSPVAGYMAMKRGIKLECIYFESPPHTSPQALNKVKKLVSILNKYQPSIKLHIINFTEIQESIYKFIDPTYMITIMRRMMYRISEKVMQNREDLVLINGESVGQVASQTLTSMTVINNVTNIPVLRPVACLDKLEIIDIAKKIDTYETSILPYEDCCTIFLPKHPVINPKIEKALEYEKKFDYEALINEAVLKVNTITISKDSNKFDI